MSRHPLGKTSVLLVAPLDLYLTAISTLDVFEEVCRQPDLLSQIVPSLPGPLLQALYPSCNSAWIAILLHCTPHPTVLPILRDMAQSFNEGRRSAGGIAVRNSKKKKANFDNDEVRRIDCANEMAYRIFFFYAKKLRGSAVFVDPNVWRLCAGRLRCDDTLQAALAVDALLAAIDVASAQARSLLSLIDEELEAVFAALTHQMRFVQDAKEMWQKLKDKLEHAIEVEAAMMNVFTIELVRATKHEKEEELDVALEHYLKDDDRLRKAHADRQKAHRDVTAAEGKMNALESRLTAAFAAARSLCLFGAMWLATIDVGEACDGPATAVQRQTRSRVESIYQAVDWDLLYVHAADEVSLCHGLSMARLLVIGAVRFSPYLQDRLATRWATEGIVELSYKGKNLENCGPDVLLPKDGPVADRNERVRSSGFYTHVPSRWYPLEETAGWQKVVSEQESLQDHRNKLLFRQVALSSRISSALCYWSCYKNETCRAALLGVRTSRDDHPGLIVQSLSQKTGRRKKNQTCEPQGELCWVNMLKYASVKNKIVRDAMDYYDSISSFHNEAGLLRSPTEKVLKRGILHHEEEPTLPYPDCTVENIAHSVTTASQLSRCTPKSLSSLLEEAAEWSAAHDYTPHSVCSKGYMCSRRLHASLNVKAHAYLLISGAEGSADLCSRRCIHPTDLITSLLTEDAKGKAVAQLHEEYRRDPAVLSCIMASWPQAAGSEGNSCDLLSRMCGFDVLSVVLTGALPAFRAPHAAMPMHSHLRTGPQLSSCVDFYRLTSTLRTTSAESNAEVSIYLSYVSEACDTLYSATPLSMLSFGCPANQARPGEGGMSIFCRSLRLLTAIASIDPVFVRRAMQRSAHQHEAAGGWTALEPDAPMLAPLYLILRGGAEALVEHYIRLEGEGGGGIFWRTLSPQPLARTAGEEAHAGQLYSHLRKWNYWHLVEKESLMARRLSAELLSVLTMGDIGLCYTLASAAKLCTGCLLGSLDVRDPILSQNIFRLSQNILLSSAGLYGGDDAELACHLFHPTASSGGHKKKPEVLTNHDTDGNRDRVSPTTTPTKSKMPNRLLSGAKNKLSVSKSLPGSPVSKPLRIPAANKIIRPPPGNLSPKTIRRASPALGWNEAFDEAVSVLPEEHNVGPVPRTVIDSTAASLVHLPFTSPLHAFRLSLAQEGDFLYYAYRMIVEATGKFTDMNNKLTKGSESIACPSTGVDTRPSDFEEDGSLFGVDSTDVLEEKEDKEVRDFERAVGALKQHDIKSLRLPSCHPSESCPCRWCRIDCRDEENRRLDVVLFAVESVTTFCAHRLELQQRMYEVADDFYAYLLPLFPHPPDRLSDTVGSIVLDERTVRFRAGDTAKAVDPMLEILRQNPSLSVDQHIQSLMSLDSFVTENSPLAVTLDKNGNDICNSPNSSSKESKEVRSASQPSAMSPLIRRKTQNAKYAVKVEDKTQLVTLPLLRAHLGLCGSCCVLVQTLIHRHDPIRSAVRESGCVGGLVRALDVATSCKDEVDAMCRMGSVDSAASSTANRKNAKSSDILDKFLAVKVVNAIEVLIVRNVQAWEQIQAEAGVRGLLRLCLVGGSSIRVLAATALMQRISENPPDFGGTTTRATNGNHPDEIECLDSYGSRASWDQGSADQRSEFGLSADSSLFEGSNFEWPVTEIGQAVSKSFNQSRATAVSEVSSATHKGKVLDDRVRGIDVWSQFKDTGVSYSSILFDQSDRINSVLGSTAVIPEETAAEKRRQEEIKVEEAMRRRIFVDELIECGCLEAISSMLESTDTVSQTSSLRFLKLVLMNSSIEIREKIIDSRRPEDSYFGPDRNNADFVFMGSTADIVKTYDKFGTANNSAPEISNTLTNGSGRSQISDADGTTKGTEDPFFISIPRIGKFLYSPELDVVRAATDVLQVLASANAAEVRKILKYYQHIEDLEVYADQVPAYKLKILDTFKQKAAEKNTRSVHNPYEEMQSLSALDDCSDASIRRRLPSMDLTSTQDDIFRLRSWPSLPPHSSADKADETEASTGHDTDVPLASRIGYRLLDMSVGRVLPLSRGTEETKGSTDRLSVSPSMGLKGVRNAAVCDPEKYIPSREEYLKEPKLMQELDHIARSAGILAGLITDGEESNYTDGAPPLTETLGKSGSVFPYCEY